MIPSVVSEGDLYGGLPLSFLGLILPARNEVQIHLECGVGCVEEGVESEKEGGRMSKVYGVGLVAILMGCSETIETYEPGMDWDQVVVERADVPPQDLKLQIRDLGATLLGSVEGAPPSTRVWIAEGLPGDGICPRKLNGACLDLVDASPFMMVITSPDGEALFSRPPRYSDAHERAYQAIVVNPNDKALMSDLAHPLL